MLKRTTGRWLLTLLVITGLAGTITDSSLSQKERKQAITLIKSSKAAILSSITGLSREQMNYKPSPAEPSIGELLMTMVALEKKCSDEIKAVMEKPSDSEDRLKITLTDDQLLAKDNYTLCKALAEEMPQDKWKNPDEALKKFITLRNQHIKYIRSSTEDLRNHVLHTPAGWIDCYQYYLLLADRSNYVAEKIEQLKSSPSFPK